MKKVFRINVDCANCASKIESTCAKLDGVKSISINFMTQKMSVEFADGVSCPEILKNIAKTCKKIDRDFEIC